MEVEILRPSKKPNLPKDPKFFKPMRIHFYLGPVVRTEIVYHFVGNSG